MTEHYTEILENGKKFDTSCDRGLPFSFEIAMEQVIE
ncbi:MAG: FKBP-type peptidyl-prolyl cis-trans isomerase [cyanobacterium endosymbiont of Rhopalodia musculus]|nr:FKBP-type peptidyl-prolyl cis-trans isomerase [cyanobacterium endosymbiont of Epithemia clementina EcSB]WGT67305.1 FKBP-type peptidyl-prolyl cis-trans isomerase [cyanobacterium endosymbiont of Epithemia clementina EcSB]